MHSEYALSDIVENVAAKLEAAHEGLGAFDAAPDSWLHRRREIFGALATELGLRFDARFKERGDVTRIRMAGISASSTNGIAGAVRNWVAAARKQVAA